MNVVFRTDASVQIGIGHVMRCLTLAEALRAQGTECVFACREHPGNLIGLIRQRGFMVITLPASMENLAPKDTANVKQFEYAAWLGTDWACDAAETKVGVGKTVVDWLIVDHYALDSHWEHAMRSICRKLMVIDDLAERDHDCDLLLDQNLGRNASDYNELVPANCHILAGPHYALLRPEFSALREDSLRRRTSPKVKHLLISMGGVDQSDATGKVLDLLKAFPLPKDVCITVVMGPHAPWLERVQLLANQMPRPTEVKVDVDNMSQLMADSDLAIGAAGSTSWERCCLGLPALIVVIADNQQRGAKALEQSGCVKLIDNVSEISQVLPAMLDLIFTTNLLTQLSQKSALIIDGHGTNRVRDLLRGQHG